MMTVIMTPLAFWTRSDSAVF